MTLGQSDIEKIINVIKEASGYDFGDYSEKSFKRRAEKILSDNKISLDNLLIKLADNNYFLEKIVKEITVNTTEIFRDTKTWQLLKYEILKKYRHKETINIWHTGCSTGQEVYSLLILLNEMGIMDKARVVATDLNTDVIDVAQKGIYRFREINEFTENYDAVMMSNPENPENTEDVHLDKYFNISRRKNIIKTKPILLNKTKYYKHNIVSDGNIFGKNFDLIFCRNVLIYFNHDLQNKLFEFFHENINKGGALIIGRHEGMLGQISTKFRKMESIYFKK